MARRVIILRGDPIQNEEDKAAEVILPGHLLAYDTSGNLIKNTVGNEKTVTSVALERDELGRGIDVPYAIGDTVRAASFAGGMRAYLWLASGENVIKGDYLENMGDGTLIKSGGSNFRVGRALEAINATSGPTRIRVEIA